MPSPASLPKWMSRIVPSWNAAIRRRGASSPYTARPAASATVVTYSSAETAHSPVMNASMRSVLPAWAMGEVADHAINLPLDLVKMSCPSSVPVKAICTAAEALSSIALGSVCRAFSGCTIVSWKS